jgi:hypothetical protein
MRRWTLLQYQILKSFSVREIINELSQKNVLSVDMKLMVISADTTGHERHVG